MFAGSVKTIVYVHLNVQEKLDIRFVCVLGFCLCDFAFSSVGVFTDVTKRAHIFASWYQPYLQLLSCARA